MLTAKPGLVWSVLSCLVSTMSVVSLYTILLDTVPKGKGGCPWSANEYHFPNTAGKFGDLSLRMVTTAGILALGGFDETLVEGAEFTQVCCAQSVSLASPSRHFGILQLDRFFFGRVEDRGLLLGPFSH